MPLDELLPKAVKLFPSKEGVVCGGVRLDYQRFAERVWKLCNGLLDLGLRRNDRLGILHENCHVFLESYFAAAHLGVILVPLNFRLSPRELSMILKDSGSRILVAQQAFQDKVSALTDMDSGIEKVIWTQRFSGGVEKRGHVEYETLLSRQKGNPPPESSIKDEDVAHLYYTSGTNAHSSSNMLLFKSVRNKCVIHYQWAMAQPSEPQWLPWL